MTGSDESWRPACGACGSTSLKRTPSGYRCSACGAPWDGSEAPEASRAVYVCPGCHAVDGEPCAPGCIDAAIEAAREERERYLDDYDDDAFSV